MIQSQSTKGRSHPAQNQNPWSIEKAAQWRREHMWLVGCNYVPATAINQLEMWQADTFDIETIDRELGWAEQLGFNSMRVFLHDLLWTQDSTGFLNRMEQFLDTADKHGIGVMFVPLDAVWDPNPKLGKQRDPRPHVHNSGWVQSPGADILNDPARHHELEPYIKGIISHFRNDRRIHAWDLYNEPGNKNGTSYGDQELAKKAEMSLMLTRKVHTWARDARPSQPITIGVWTGDWSDPAKLSPQAKFQLENSDVISFHSYSPLEKVKELVQDLKRYNRPILCTEYMARTAGSTFDPILGYFKDHQIGAYNWGFVSGKSQTIYPWESWAKQYTAEPEVWFHDIIRPDGKPYSRQEVQYIKRMTSPEGKKE